MGALGSTEPHEEGWGEQAEEEKLQFLVFFSWTVEASVISESSHLKQTESHLCLVFHIVSIAAVVQLPPGEHHTDRRHVELSGTKETLFPKSVQLRVWDLSEGRCAAVRVDGASSDLNRDLITSFWTSRPDQRQLILTPHLGAERGPDPPLGSSWINRRRAERFGLRASTRVRLTGFWFRAWAVFGFSLETWAECVCLTEAVVCVSAKRTKSFETFVQNAGVSQVWVETTVESGKSSNRCDLGTIWGFSGGN